MLITHDMGVIAEACDRLAVTYAGRIAEVGPVHELISRPTHPYTAGLIATIPDISMDRERLNQIDGAVRPACWLHTPGARAAEAQASSLQQWPSRAIMALAALGPQLPAA